MIIPMPMMMYGGLGIKDMIGMWIAFNITCVLGYIIGSIIDRDIRPNMDIDCSFVKWMSQYGIIIINILAFMITLMLVITEIL